MKPKLLVLDIETMPGIAYVWKMYDENIALDQLIAPGRVISWAAKWLHQKGVMQADEWMSNDTPNCGEYMIALLHNLLKEADAVITFNGDRFDLQKINGEFIKFGLPPLPPIPSIDLYKTTKKFGYISGKLQHMVEQFRLGKKKDTGGFKLWRGWAEGDCASILKMRRYNIHDVVLTARLYRHILPYIKNHPYMGRVHLETDKPECPACTSHRVQSRGIRRTKMYFIDRLQCQSCGSWFDGPRRKVVRKKV